jgi:hypothetical protein
VTEDHHPRRALPAETKYRGMNSGGWIDKEQDPWGVAVKAFLRKDKDTDGITVLTRPHLCCSLNIRGIGQISVQDIETVTSPIDNQSLYVEENTANHGYIGNVPFHSQHPQAANDVATDLAELCRLLNDQDFEEAKERWAATLPTASNRGTAPK